MLKKISPSDHPRLKPYFDAQLYPLCPYSLASMIIWSGCVHEAFWREENGALFLSEIDIEEPRQGRLLLPLLRPFRYPTPRELADTARALGYQEYHYVPQDYVEIIGSDNIAAYFNVTEESGYGDYIYNTQDMAQLRGHKYSRKRNMISQFCKAAGPGVKVHPLEGAWLEKCLRVFDDWQTRQGGPVIADIPNCERKAIVNGLSHFRELGMTGVAVEAGGKVAGFAFGSRLTADTWTLNFEKADAAVKGLYQFLDSEAAKTVPAEYRFINKENDLGLPGLRKAKESYYPARFVKSYILGLKA